MNKLQFLDAWKDGVSSFFVKRSAQGILGANLAMATAGACGASCGAGDTEKKDEPKPSACGSSCGASDDGEKKEEPKAACGASCGASDGE